MCQQRVASQPLPPVYVDGGLETILYRPVKYFFLAGAVQKGAITWSKDNRDATTKYN